MMAAIMTTLTFDRDELALLVQYTVTPARLAMEEHMKTYASKHAGPWLTTPSPTAPSMSFIASLWLHTRPLSDTCLEIDKFLTDGIKMGEVVGV